MRIGAIAAACASLLTVVACGGSSKSPSTGPEVASSATISLYQDLATRVQSAAVAYGATMAGPGMTLSGCPAAHDAYDAQVRPWISQMLQMSGAMDAFMDAHGGYGYADMACVANAMLQELDAHRLVACTYPTLNDDLTEASRHVGVMTSYAGHVYDRCGQMMGGQYTWGPAAPACGGTSGGSPSDPLALGQRIFDTGIGTDGQPIPRTGGYGMMMTSGCASCHGYDGLGRTMMMFTTPNITYANLTDPAGMLDPDGSRGPTYTDDLIRRAITQGIDADGSALSTIMPRWQLSDDDWSDLLLFLKSLPAAGSSGGGGTPTSGTISGTVVKGPVAGAAVAAFAIVNGAMGALVGSGTTDASGSFTVSIGSYAGPLTLQATAGTFADEATGTIMPLMSGDVLAACIPALTAGAATTGIQLTPLTSMACARARALTGGTTPANVAAANAAVGAYFSINDILRTTPMDPMVAGSGTGATQDQKNYGMVVAAMSQYAQSIGMTASSSSLVTAMARDASDGVMDGMMGSTGISLAGMGGMTSGTMQATAGTSGLAAAMSTFIGSSMNKSGVPVADMQSLMDQLAASNGQLGGAGGVTTTPSGTVTGTAFMGGVRSGTVAAYAVNGGMMGAQLGNSYVDASGSFSIPLGAYSGTIMLQMTGGAFVDEATGITMTMQSGDVLTSCIPSFAAGSAMSGVQITPLTSMAQARAQGMPGGMTAANVAAANTAVGAYFNVGDILMTAPMDPAAAGSGAAADPSAKNHGMTVAAMSQYAHAVGMTVSSSEIFTAMMEDGSDGVMNGLMGSTPISMGGMSGTGGMMAGYTMQANAGTTGLATAMTAFVGSSSNASGVAMADMQPLVDRLAASNGTIQ